MPGKSRLLNDSIMMRMRTRSRAGSQEKKKAPEMISEAFSFSSAD